MNESDLSDAALAELLTLTIEVIRNGTIIYRNHLGQAHRIHGPAYVTSSGYKEWWLDGEEFSEEEWNERVKSV